MSIENPGASLVFSSDGLMPGYLGKATYQSTTAPDGTFHGYSTYTFSYSGSIVPVLKLVSGRNTAFRGMSYSAGVWTITVYHGGTPVDANGFETQYVADVYVWGVPVSVSGFGLSIYDASGNLAGDLTKRPLIIGQKINWSNATFSEAVSASIVTPGIIGCTNDWKREVLGSGPTWEVNFLSGVWTLSTGTLNRNFARIQHYPTEDTNQGGTSIVWQPCRALLVDVNGLT